MNYIFALSDIQPVEEGFGAFALEPYIVVEMQIVAVSVSRVNLHEPKNDVSKNEYGTC